MYRKNIDYFLQFIDGNFAFCLPPWGGRWDCLLFLDDSFSGEILAFTFFNDLAIYLLKLWGWLPDRDFFQ
jgi:hypothetical protein